MKKRADKVIWYVVALVAIIALLMFAFREDMGLSPSNSRGKNAAAKQDASSLIRIGIGADVSVINAFMPKASQLISEEVEPSSDGRIINAFVKGGRE